MKKYVILWTHVDSHSEYAGETVVAANSEEEAEKKFFRTRTEANPYKGCFAGYIVDNIIAA